MREAVVAKAGEIIKRAESGTTIDALAQESGAEVRSELGLKRNETSATFDGAAVSALFSVPDNGFAYAPEPDGRGAKIMQALPVMSPPFDSNSKEAQAARDALKTGIANDMLALYVADLQSRFGVTINNTLWQQVTGGSL
jgi:peptidyl-prolyl cis-trans isomerase D